MWHKYFENTGLKFEEKYLPSFIMKQNVIFLGIYAEKKPRVGYAKDWGGEEE